MIESTSQGAPTEAAYYILPSMNKLTHDYTVMQNIDKLTKRQTTSWNKNTVWRN
ncbi:MAG: hypothetical protein FWG55_05780 [Candidatus Bathyarchaeota archaeon]|nr:hypothetical protein [Candidatus Termiticorpusculum sp.]